MKLPRAVAGPELVRALRMLGSAVDRQRGSPVRVTTQRDGEHREAIPNHPPLKVGTLFRVPKSVATHHSCTAEALIRQLGL